MTDRNAPKYADCDGSLHSADLAINKCNQHGCRREEAQSVVDGHSLLSVCNNL